MPTLTEAPPPWLDAAPPRLRAALADAAAGAPANVALMRLLLDCAGPDDAEAALAAALRALDPAQDGAAAERLSAVRDLLRAEPGASAVVRSIAGGLDHTRRGASPGEFLTYLAEAFDAAAQRNAEASVALYALGRPELLAAATAEVAARLEEWRLIGGRPEVLDIGCGIGRFELALAGRVRRIVGVDISPVMLAEARRRCAACANAEFREVSGRDLAEFVDASFDLALAVDCFPYLVQAGGRLPETMLAESARVLRPGGRLLILNFSYRGDPTRDRDELWALAARVGLRPVRFATKDFSLWDAATFDLENP